MTNHHVVFHVHVYVHVHVHVHVVHVVYVARHIPPPHYYHVDLRNDMKTWMVMITRVVV